MFRERGAVFVSANQTNQPTTPVLPQTCQPKTCRSDRDKVSKAKGRKIVSEGLPGGAVTPGGCGAAADAGRGGGWRRQPRSEPAPLETAASHSGRGTRT